MPETNLPWLAPLRVSELDQDRPTPFDLRPDSEARAALARDLGILAIRKLRLQGNIAPSGARDWRLSAELGATVEQACVVTGQPVTTRIDAPVRREFLAEYSEPDAGSETEVPDNDDQEPLGTFIDPGLTMAEALSLALPDYPRAPDATIDAADFAPPGVTPLTDETAKPFAGLSALRDSLEKKDRK